ncbi:MAG: tetratricopeptide repeat protein [Sulfuricurvum sp.]
MKKLLLLTSFFFLPSLFASSQDSFWDSYTNALRGDKIAQFQVGVMFERGIGIDINQTQSAKWYEKAAIQGHMDAQYNIGLMYVSGRGVEQSDQFAMMWLASAAKQGDKEARKLLLAMIDGKLDKKTDNAIDGELESIKAIAFTTKEGAKVCDSKGKCEPTKANTTFTSKFKQKNYYKISGIGTVIGWKPYDKEGWIEDNSVVIRR